MSIQLSAEQLAAADQLQTFIENGKAGSFCTMHGLAGSGKTTVLAALARYNPTMDLVTLTGKASDVLRRKVGRPVQTVHSYFYNLDEIVRRDDGREDMTWKELHGTNDLWGKTVACDEVSMIPEDIARDMLRTGCKIIAVGDPGQLKPVKGQQFFTKPDITLKQIHRQALDSPIIRQAHWVRLGREYFSDGEGFQVVPRATRELVLACDVILCWRNNTRNACNGLMRRGRGFEKPHPQAGEPVLCLKNAPDFGVFNGGVYPLLQDFVEGDINITLEVDGREQVVPNVTFENIPDSNMEGIKQSSKFTYGYALTVHKAQGSEWDKVLLMDEYGRDFDDLKNWLYTGITRAAKQMLVIRR